ncbi:hypothetical protein NI389_12150 [Pseudoalteromonas xiamenensis]|uniref:hypothetical protein n=1 Tax=Pseudoalteromonas xiamenensis TaxID=882626 RepID=UPI0027E4FA6B|nr:hypothetical protein [Pseudoalteromonas xiamenensis]WMN58966.1 hypothetical protein NI389_12150 [Pseudoalteromonas xiamenensis]
MAFLINVLMHFTTKHKLMPTIVTSFYVFLSYFISDDLASLTVQPNAYLNWAIFDLVTITLIFTTLKVAKLPFNTASYYVFGGLSISTLLYLSMHIDVDIYSNRTPWILWDIFGYGGTLVDLMMITVLILNRDILQLGRLFNRGSKPNPIELSAK